jgi:hypothetical protein
LTSKYIFFNDWKIFTPYNKEVVLNQGIDFDFDIYEGILYFKSIYEKKVGITSLCGFD